MRKEKIAVVGDKDSVLAFKAVGLDVFPILDEEEASDKVRLLAREYAVIFVTEKLAAKMEPLLKRYKARAYPAVIPIPDASGSTGFGLYGIKKDVEKAIGADILFNRED